MSHLACPDLDFLNIAAFAVAWRMIVLITVVFVPLTFLLSFLSFFHFTAWGKLASQWQRTRLIFASFERKAIGNSQDMFAPLRKAKTDGQGSRRSMFLGAAAGTAFVLQLGLLVTLFSARHDHKETTVMYTAVVACAAGIGFQSKLMVNYFNFSRKPGTTTGSSSDSSGRTRGTSGATVEVVAEVVAKGESNDAKIDKAQRLLAFHSNMMFYPAKVSFLSGMCYCSALFALMHYYRKLVDASEGVPANAPTGPCVGPCDGCWTAETLDAMLPGTDTVCGDHMKHNASCSIQCPGAFKQAHDYAPLRGDNQTYGSGKLICWDGTLFTSIHCVEYLCPRNLFDGFNVMTSTGAWMVGLATFWYAASYLPLGALVVLHYSYFTAAAQRISELQAKLD